MFLCSKSLHTGISAILYVYNVWAEKVISIHSNVSQSGRANDSPTYCSCDKMHYWPVLYEIRIKIILKLCNSLLVDKKHLKNMWQILHGEANFSKKHLKNV